ncbi:MAG: hypothetical protein JSR46_11140 [Verrucomicrobia bacterium]|nr:hypothetical protein [Verrucomicrobiota bacterium]
MSPLSELAPAARALLPESTAEIPYKDPSPIVLVPKRRGSIECSKQAGHYFMGGLPALMQAVRFLRQNPTSVVTYVNDGERKKSTQSAHQGHVHPTEWTTPELGVWPLLKIILKSLHLLPATSPEDVAHYSYIHFPLSKMRPSLFVRNIAFKLMRALRSKNGVSEDDRWQCDAVRASLAFHKEVSDEIEAAGQEPTFVSGWRLIWSPDRLGIEKKRALWHELGIHTELLCLDELRTCTLLRDDIPLYGLKVLGDGKFFPNVDQKITSHLSRKYPNTFEERTASVSKVYIDEETNRPFAVEELLPDGSSQTVAVDSFYGSPGHNQVFKSGSKKPLWDEVPVTGVSTLWVASIAKKELVKRFGTDEDLVNCLKQFPGSANLTNLHITIWDAVVDGDTVHIVARATQGANFNAIYADPNDLANMTANINRFFIGSWKLITAGSCTRKTTISNVPEFKDHFIHGLSGIGFSFSAAPISHLSGAIKLSEDPLEYQQRIREEWH